MPPILGTLSIAQHDAMQRMSLHREVTSGAGGPGVQDSAEGLHILACRPNSEDHCTAQGWVRTMFLLGEVRRVPKVINAPSMCP